ncbi:hypothetical protein [Hellea balneolensis]|uniref:hypothetical protein n=1 Tax=Hellea balneolensis TaxID=287478 RepID=UPI0012B7E5D3|nr:hypothetical protein [Hellea balneolensis]
MLRTNQMKSSSQSLSKMFAKLFPSMETSALIPVTYEADPSRDRLEYARFNRQSPRRRRYRRSGAARPPADVKSSWF